jgi:hypothetical protein
MDKQKTLWYKGAIIGAVLCVTIFAVYFVSIPLLGWQSNSRLDRLIMTSGHAYIVLLGFVVHPSDYCGSLGSACSVPLGILIFFGAAAALIAIYMAIGALIGRIVEIALKRRAKQ